MKKLQLKLHGKQMLTKEQMKKVVGGDPGPCGYPTFDECWCRIGSMYYSFDLSDGNCWEELGIWSTPFDLEVQDMQRDCIGTGGEFWCGTV
jgi:hypothetical protein